LNSLFLSTGQVQYVTCWVD